MAKSYRVGVAGLVHDHVWGELPHWMNHPQAEVVAAADSNPPLTERIQKEFSVEKIYDSVETMLDAEDLDVLQICTSNRDHVPAVQAAAARGVHCVVEKPMAHTLEGADAMLSAVTEADVRLAVNWPIQWNVSVRRAMDMVKAGDIGRTFNARIRMAHEGPRELGCSPYFCG
ncbi:MAG: Gfo/Idh/MocA family oxidoreductase, partial [Planctomycetales bacterium]